MEMTAFELEALAAEKLNKEFWAILENNGMLRIHTRRDRDALVQKVPRRVGVYLVTAA
jgi:hypothetical protein